jgi:hypothetical protein
MMMKLKPTKQSNNFLIVSILNQVNFKCGAGEPLLKIYLAYNCGPLLHTELAS